MDKDLSEINNASKSIFSTVGTNTLQETRKKLEKYDGISNFRYLKKQSDQIIPLDVFFFIKNSIMCMQPTCVATKDAVHLLKNIFL